MKTLKDIYEDYAEPGLPFAIFKSRLYDFLLDLDEAARHVYESWMGGTMDDVRRDMVKLGKVLNTRKEEEK